MIDAIDVLTSHFQELADSLSGVDLGAIESAAWALLIAVESLDRGLGVLPMPGPDFTNCTSARDLAAAAQQRIDVMDAHLILHQRAHAAIGALLLAFEQAREAGEAAEHITREIDRLILTLERSNP